MKKHFIASALTLAMCLSITTGCSSQGVLTNPPAATTLAEVKTVSTTENSTKATIGQIASRLVEAAEWQSVVPAENSYGVKDNEEGQNALRLVTKGILDGTEAAKLSNGMTRENFFVMLGGALGLEGDEDSTSIYKFADAQDADKTAIPMLCRMYTRGILTGDTENNLFRPQDQITLAEVDEALDRAYNRQFAPAGTTLIPLDEPYLTKNFNRFGKMDPSLEAHQNIHLLKEEPFRIVDNIYFVGNTWTASYLIDTGDGLILLDNSTQDYYPLLLESIYELGFDPKDIKYIILSHAHGDHYGCVKLLKDLCPDAITFVGEVDAPALIDGMQKISYEITDYGFGSNGYYSYNEGFIPDVLVKDGDYIELGNTKIECVTTPGHTDGVQSHFWTTPSGYKIGLYGGAGFSSMATNRLEARGYDPEEVTRWQEIFVESIDKVWDREVDIMLGNHPFHADLFEKHERVMAGEKDAFIDSTEWHRFLQELKDCYEVFLTLTPEEVDEMYSKSYLFVFRDKALDEHEWPWVEDN